MRQAFLPRPGTVEQREVPVARPGAGEILVRVARVGICGSDLHVFHGVHPIVAPPLVQGHEFSGWVDSPGVPSTPVHGALVTVNPAIGCGHCDSCTIGLSGQCERMRFIGGAALPGALSDWIAVPARQITVLDPGTSPADAAMTEPLACAVRAVGRSGGVAGRRVLVAGAGTIGNLVAQVARDAGASVAVVEKAPARRARAVDCGLPCAPTAAEAIDLLGGPPAVAFECAGAAGALDDCVAAVPRRGTVVVVGVHARRPSVDICAVQDRELNLVGSLMYSRAEFAQAAAKVSAGVFALAPLRTHEFDLTALDRAYAVLDDPDAGALKVMVRVGDAGA